MPKIERTTEPGVWKVTGTYTTHWRATVDLGKDASGKRQQRTRTFATFREAVDWRIATRHRLRERTYIEPSDEPLSAFLARWLDTLSRPGPASMHRYRQFVARQIEPHLGAVALGRLTPEQIDGWTARLSRDGLKPKTIQAAFVLLNQALATALRWQLIAANPAASARPPRVPRRETTVWDAGELRAFLAFTAADSLAPLWQMAAMLGLRRGELIALGWADVDLDRALVTVRHSLTRDAAGGWVVGSPKTDASRRTIPLPASIVGSLRLHHYQQAERREIIADGWQDSGLVFERGDGRLLPVATLYQRFVRLTLAAGLPRIRFHDLRHSAATYLLTDLKIPLLLVARILGHTSVSITGDVYGSVGVDDLRDVARQLDARYGGAPDSLA